MQIFHPRIYPLNYKILAKYPADHPAVRALQVHAEARDVCVGKEIAWPNGRTETIDQTWFSTIDQRVWRFSAFAYAFISFDLLLDGWLGDELGAVGQFEMDFIHELPRLRGLLYECESAANKEGNKLILPLISKAHEFFTAFEKSIIARDGPNQFSLHNRSVKSLWGAGKPE